jgi:cytoskeletal protein CcmA (bactofilin family)
MGEYMFRRGPKNPLEDNLANYNEEPSSASPYKYNAPSHFPNGESVSRPYESPTAQLATPLKKVTEESSWNKQQDDLPHPFEPQLSQESPETTLGEGVTFRGELSFERLLRIDGTFEGELLSQGKVVVGPKGKVKANLKLREAIIEGVVEGNITVEEKLELRGDARIQGDITAKTLCVDEGVSIHGIVSVGERNSSTL